jgi:hypothetical protein
MPSIDKKYYHNLNLDSNEIKAGRIYNLTTTQRNALSLTTTDKGYLVYDITLLSLFVWNGTAWTSAGGGSQNLQQVTDIGNTTTNDIVLDSTSGEYPNNYISQNTVTDSSVNINYSNIINNIITNLQPNLLQLTSSYAYNYTNASLTSDALYLQSQDSNNINNRGNVFLGSSDNVGSAYLGLNNKLNKTGYLKVSDLTNTNVILEFPNKATGTYTIATTADIPQNPSLQDVVNTGNGISNYGGSGIASIQSTNFTNDRTLYLNNDTNPTIKIVDNLDSNHYTTIDIDTLNLNGASYNWQDIIVQSIYVALPFTTDHLTATNNPYLIDDVVWYLGNVYRCIANNDSILPTNTSYWALIGVGYPLIQQPVDWNSTSGNNQILNKPTISVSVGFEQNFLLMGA